MVRIITNADIEANLTMEDCIDALRSMFVEMGNRRAITGSREDILSPVPDPPIEAQENLTYALKSMGGVLPAAAVGAIRINSDVIQWRRRESGLRREQIPAARGRYTGLVLLFSVNTGAPLAIFPDSIVQSYRVGATSAIGAEQLARDDVSTLGLLGSGWQARAHLIAHDTVQTLDRVLVYSPSPTNRTAFAEEMDRRVRPDVEAVASPEVLFREARLIQCATNALSPVFEARWIEPGTHVGIINSHEAPEEFLESETIDAVVQSWTQITRIEEVDQVTTRELPTKDINNYVVGDHSVPKLERRDRQPRVDWSAIPSLGEVLVGDVTGRTSDQDVTAFFNRGMGIQFAAVGAKLLEIAEREELGDTIPTELLTQTDPG